MQGGDEGGGVSAEAEALLCAQVCKPVPLKPVPDLMLHRFADKSCNQNH